jgi:hypothetical protein
MRLAQDDLNRARMSLAGKVQRHAKLNEERKACTFEQPIKASELDHEIWLVEHAIEVAKLSVDKATKLLQDLTDAKAKYKRKYEAAYALCEAARAKFKSGEITHSEYLAELQVVLLKHQAALDEYEAATSAPEPLGIIWEKDPELDHACGNVCVSCGGPGE